jgi:hypothetical protein
MQDVLHSAPLDLRSLSAPDSAPLSVLTPLSAPLHARRRLTLYLWKSLELAQI